MARSSAPFLSVREVVKTVRDGRSRRTILADVSFDLERGSFAILRGASGSGKTTLLAIIGAMLAPTSGEVLIDGEATSRIRDAHRARVRREKVGFVFQDVQLIDGMNAIENVLLPAVPTGVDVAIEKRARDLLDRFGVLSLENSKARALSGGERQRVALARALLFDAPLLLLDEPTAHLEDSRATSVMSDLAVLASEGRTVLVATHDARVLAHAQDALLFEMAEGRITLGSR